MTSCVGYILETLRCKKLLLYRDIAWVCNVQHYGVTLGVTFGFAKMSSAAIFETYFSFCRGIWIAATG